MDAQYLRLCLLIDMTKIALTIPMEKINILGHYLSEIFLKMKCAISFLLRRDKLDSWINCFYLVLVSMPLCLK